MDSFPYFPILKQAYEISKGRYWLWIFGLFIGGASGLDLLAIKYFSDSSESQLPKLREISGQFLAWINENPAAFWAVVVLVLLIFAVLIVFQGLAKSAVIWAAARLSREAKSQISK